jgi:hypothetical protein
MRIVAAITGVLDEKASASQVLGSYPEHTGALYAPHIEETLNMLIKMGNYFHCQVREQAYTSLPLLFTATLQAFPAQPSGGPSTLALLLFLITLPAGNVLGQALAPQCQCVIAVSSCCKSLSVQVCMPTHDAAKHAVVLSMLSSRFCVPYID